MTINQVISLFIAVLTNQLSKMLYSIVHTMQYGFIVGKDIVHNILNGRDDGWLWQGIEIRNCYDTTIYQECMWSCMLFAHCWSYIFHMGLGARMLVITFMFGLCAMSYIVFLLNVQYHWYGQYYQDQLIIDTICHFVLL